MLCSILHDCIGDRIPDIGMRFHFINGSSVDIDLFYPGIVSSATVLFCES